MILGRERGRSKDMVNFNESSYKGLMNTMGEHSKELLNHSLMVSDLSIKIGEALKMSRDDLDVLKWGSLLFDVGKTHVSNEILQKKKLDGMENCLLQNHVNEGILMVKKYTNNKDILGIIGLHHLCCDSSGYKCVGGEYRYNKHVAIVQLSDTLYQRLGRNITDRSVQSVLSGLGWVKYDPLLVKLLLKNSHWVVESALKN